MNYNIDQSVHDLGNILHKAVAFSRSLKMDSTDFFATNFVLSPSHSNLLLHNRNITSYQRPNGYTIG